MAPAVSRFPHRDLLRDKKELANAFHTPMQTSKPVTPQT